MKIAPQIKLETKINISPKITSELRLTPQMRQAIMILRLPLLELKSFLDKELIENPLLEEATSRGEDELKAGSEIDKLIEQIEGDFAERNQVYDSQMQKRRDFLERCLTKPITLAEHLSSQLRMLNLSESEQRIGEMIIGSLDDNGYLRFSLNEIAEMLGVDIEQAQRALYIIQALDPPGVGARNLEECLLIQLRAKGRNDSLAGLIVKLHLFNLEMKRYDKISKTLGVSILEIKHARDEIARLEPKPGRNFGCQQTINIIPDAILQKIEDDYRVESKAKEFLQFRVNPHYKKMLKEKNIPESAKKYLREKLASALWLIRAVEQRQDTIRKIIECIIDLQREFLDKGSLYLKPLQLKDIANILGMHKSTISRAVADKYIQTPQGVFELRYFFDEGLKNACQNHSYKSIKVQIESLINEENPQKPLSDEKIVLILRGQGIHIARRTVAKYREELRILPSYLRKQ
jgi:RNA polymerase sigma-54 factor